MTSAPNIVNQVMATLGRGPVEISGVAAGIGVLLVVQGGYVTEVMRGAIIAVPVGQIEATRAHGMPRVTLPAMLSFAVPGSVARGQLESTRAFGMSRWLIFRRIWAPQAIRSALPTLAGETILQLKATPLVATITFIEVYAVTARVRQDTFIVYEPLLLLAVIYTAIAGIIALDVPPA